MKNATVFIASSSELKKARIELVDLLQDLKYKVGGEEITFKPVLWEFMDSSMGKTRKEDEYLEALRRCDICLVLFWHTLGEYTVEELNIAVSERALGKKPKHIFVFFKEPAGEVSSELKDFKQNFTLIYPDIPKYIFADEKTLRDTVASIFQGRSNTFVQ